MKNLNLPLIGLILLLISWGFFMGRISINQSSHERIIYEEDPDCRIKIQLVNRLPVLEDSLAEALSLADMYRQKAEALEAMMNLRRPGKVKEEPVLSKQNQEAEELRAILVAMDYGDEVQRELESKSNLPDNNREAEELPKAEIDYELPPPAMEVEAKLPKIYINPIRWGGSVGIGHSFRRNKPFVSAGLHASNNDWLVGVEYLFDENILQARVGWKF